MIIVIMAGVIGLLSLAVWLLLQDDEPEKRKYQ
jgi:hypothetical protein